MRKQLGKEGSWPGPDAGTCARAAPSARTPRQLRDFRRLPPRAPRLRPGLPPATCKEPGGDRPLAARTDHPRPHAHLRCLAATCARGGAGSKARRRGRGLSQSTPGGGDRGRGLSQSTPARAGIGGGAGHKARREAGTGGGACRRRLLPQLSGLRVVCDLQRPGGGLAPRFNSGGYGAPRG